MYPSPWPACIRRGGSRSGSANAPWRGHYFSICSTSMEYVNGNDARVVVDSSCMPELPQSTWDAASGDCWSVKANDVIRSAQIRPTFGISSLPLLIFTRSLRLRFTTREEAHLAQVSRALFCSVTFASVYPSLATWAPFWRSSCARAFVVVHLWGDSEWGQRYEHVRPSYFRAFVQGPAKKWFPGCENFVLAVAYHFCLALPEKFSQPANPSFAGPCIVGLYSIRQHEFSIIGFIRLPFLVRAVTETLLRLRRKCTERKIYMLFTSTGTFIIERRP